MYKIINMQLEKGASKKQFLKNGLEWNLVMKSFKKQLLHMQINIPKAKHSVKEHITAKTPKGSTKSRLEKKK